MRKVLFLLLVTFMILSAAACGGATVDEPVVPPDTIEPPETPESIEVDASPPPAAQETEPPASAEDDTDETFSEPTFEYSVIWYGREISVGMRFFEVLDLGFEYSRRATEVTGRGVDAELAQEIAGRMAEPMLRIEKFLALDGDVLKIFVVNFSEEPRSIMESHIVEIRSSTPQDLFFTGNIYYDGLLINLNTSFSDVQNRFGDDGRAGENVLRYDYESGRRAGERFINFHFDVNTNNFDFFIIRNCLNPKLSDAVWDGELRLPIMR